MKQENKLYPNIRFKGFEGAWEEKRIEDIAYIRGGFAFSSSNFKSKGVPIIRISNILSSGVVGGEYIYYPEQKNDENYLISDQGLLIAMSGATIGKVAVLNNPSNRKFYQNQRIGYFIPNKNIENSFLITRIKSKSFSLQIKRFFVIGAQPNISSNDLKNLKVFITSDKKEQRLRLVELGILEKLI